MNFTLPTTSKGIIKIVVIAIAIGAIACVGSLSFCLIFNVKPEPVILTAFVALTGQLVGSLTGLLINTRSTPGTDAEMPKVITDKPTP
jgi:uncharacterized membrane protein YjjB (DUF3815 family)